MTRCLMVHPEFRSPSFWKYRPTCELTGARYPAAPLGLITVAALLPKDWEIRLFDRNVDDWDPSLLDWADVVMTGGMLPQQNDCLDVIRMARAKGKKVIVGGPDPTSSPHLYAEADHLVLGEAEVTLPMYLADAAQGTAHRVYRSEARADVSGSPCPRFDLLRFDRYLHVGIQWCRGCPFNCEFCDIIELFGRVPRAKSSAQILVELETLYALGYRGHVDLVDDNFIGNKKLVKTFLPELKTWLEKHNWPFEFSTEASINLADDDALLKLMQSVGFFAIFVGIESPDEATLVATQKRQNTHRSIADSIRTINRHGIFVNAGYILGFDTEAAGTARGIIECIEATAIPVNMAGLLTALPGTQLTKRLVREGRLHTDFDLAPEETGDQCTGGLNFETMRPREDILADYLEVIEAIYEPRHYFGRVLRTALELDTSQAKYKPSRKLLGRQLRALWTLCRTLGSWPETRAHFWNVVSTVLRKNPGGFRHAVSLMALYLHMGPFSRYVAERTRKSIKTEHERAKAARPRSLVGVAMAGAAAID